MKIKITGPDGKTYRVEVPEGTNPEATVEQFGKDMGWVKGESLAKETADTAAITAGGFTKGAREGGNPLNMLGSMATMTEPSIAAMPVQAAAFKALGLAPDAVSSFAKKNAPVTDPIRVWDAPQNAAVRAGFKDVTGYDPATDLKDTASAVKATGAEMTPLRKILSSGAEIAGGQLPYLATGPVGPGLKMMAGSALLGGVGDAALGEPGKLAGALVGAFAPGVIGRSMTNSAAAKASPPPVVPTERQASEGLSKALLSTYAKEKALVTPDIERVKESLKSISTRGTRLDNHIGHYVDNLTAERQAWLRGAGLDRLEKVAQAKKIPLNEVDDILSSMKATAREMRAGDPRRVEVEKFIGHMQEGMSGVVPGMRQAYKQYGQFKADFEGNKRLGNLFQRNSDRTPKVPPSEMGDVAGRLPVEGTESLKQYPGIRDAMLGYEKARKVEIVQKALADAKLSAPTFSASGYENAIRLQFKNLAKNTEKMALFSPAEKEAIEHIANGGWFTNRLRNVGRAAPAGAMMKGIYGTALGTSAATANPILALLAAGTAGVTSAARAGARGIQSRNAKLVEEMVRRGAPRPRPGTLTPDLLAVPGFGAGRLSEQ